MICKYGGMHGVVRHSVGIRGGGVHGVVLHNVNVLGLACTAWAGALWACTAWT
jgi:hypothetical protein